VLTDCDPFTKEYYSKKYGLGKLRKISWLWLLYQ
jgi:hypothetical protein